MIFILISLNLVFTNNTPPTSGNIEYALHKIGDAKNAYTKHEILQALNDLNGWAHHSNNPREFCNEFFELAGISRILKFLMVPSNMGDMEYVHLVGCTISNCIYRGQNDENRDTAERMAKKFVERGGVHTMLLANEDYSGGSESNTLMSVDSIWVVLGNVFSQKTVFDDIDKVKQLNILDDFLATLRLLNGTNNETQVPRIKCQLLQVLGFLICPNTKLVAGDFEGRDVFQTCIDGMTDSNRQWAFNEESWASASNAFAHCFNQKLFSTQNNNDLKLVVSFYVAYIEKAPNEAFKSGTF
jgi:hypothetical protein